MFIFQLLASYGMNHGIEDKSVELTVDGKVKKTNDSIPQWLIRKWIEYFVYICQSILVKHVKLYMRYHHSAVKFLQTDSHNPPKGPLWGQ